VRLKWGTTEYKGTLVSVDSYMNLQMSGTEEFVDGKSTGSLGQVLIRYALLGGRLSVEARVERVEANEVCTGVITYCGYRRQRLGQARIRRWRTDRGGMGMMDRNFS
jgi:hypothetical protein